MKRSPPSYTSSNDTDTDIDNPSNYSPSLGESQDIKPIFSSPPSSARSIPRNPNLTMKTKVSNPKHPHLKNEIIAVGYKNANLDELANKLGMSKRQLIDQLVPNKSNLRGKMVTMAKSM
ncbi:hypothetical protein V865_007336 [Kwoniella europaea PYCC6329]|uniref:LysM domain-containing protein n=1 Tax=Kwoniella europaea PYCC6329 TaxID=1423913 RepID=A0AAX4KSM1_9TREE